MWQTEQRVTVTEGTGRRSSVHLDGVQGEEGRENAVDAAPEETVPERSVLPLKEPSEPQT